MKFIKLTQGKFALVDDEDYELVSKHKWQYCLVGRHRDRECAMSRSWWKGHGKKRTIIMSRLIMNAPKGMVVDHKNLDTLDNRRDNLRVCTNQQNIFNSKPMKNKSSRYKGVSWNKVIKKWEAYISPNGKQIALGYYENEIDAAKAYNKAALKYYKEFARLNNV